MLPVQETWRCLLRSAFQFTLCVDKVHGKSTVVGGSSLLSAAVAISGRTLCTCTTSRSYQGVYCFDRLNWPHTNLMEDVWCVANMEVSDTSRHNNKIKSAIKSGRVLPGTSTAPRALPSHRTDVLISAKSWPSQALRAQRNIRFRMFACLS